MRHWGAGGCSASLYGLPLWLFLLPFLHTAHLARSVYSSARDDARLPFVSIISTAHESAKDNNQTEVQPPRAAIAASAPISRTPHGAHLEFRAPLRKLGNKKERDGPHFVPHLEQLAQLQSGRAKELLLELKRNDWLPYFNVSVLQRDTGSSTCSRSHAVAASRRAPSVLQFDLFRQIVEEVSGPSSFSPPIPSIFNLASSRPTCCTMSARRRRTC